MPTVVQFRRGTTAQNDAFTGAVGEISVDTEKDTLRVHDGSTQGGFEVVNTTSTQTLSNKTIGSNLLPSVDSAYDLGSASFKWKDLYLSGNTIFLGNAQISATGTSIVLPSGTQIGGTTIAALDSAGIRGLFSASGDLTYNPGTGEFSFDVESVYTKANFDSDLGLALSTNAVTTTNLSEGTNLYYTTARADSDAKNAISVTDTGGDGSLTYSATTGVLTYTGPSAAEVRAHFSGGTGITITDGSIATNDGAIVHDNLSGFVSNEHIDHSSVTLTAGNGLTGGGDITTSRTFAVGAGTGVTVNANDVAIGQDVATTANVIFNSLTTTDGLIVGGNLQVNGTTTTVNTQNLSIADNMFYLNQLESAGSPTLSVDVGWAANVNDDGTYMHVGMFRDATDNTFKVFENYLPEPDSAIEINTGDVSFSLAPFAARTLSGIYLGADSDIDARLSGGTGITYSSGVISTNDAQIIHDNLSGFVANEHIDHSTVSITAGSGLTGGGTIAATRTLNIGQGTGITVSADAISTNDAEIVHDNLSGFVANEHIDHSTVSITAGNGLTGGGTIAATRTLSVGAGTAITVTADAVSVSAGGITSTQLASAVSLIIYNSAGTALKTLYGAGS